MAALLQGRAPSSCSPGWGCVDDCYSLDPPCIGGTLPCEAEKSSLDAYVCTNSQGNKLKIGFDWGRCGNLFFPVCGGLCAFLFVTCGTTHPVKDGLSLLKATWDATSAQALSLVREETGSSEGRFSHPSFNGCLHLSQPWVLRVAWAKNLGRCKRHDPKICSLCAICISAHETRRGAKKCSQDVWGAPSIFSERPQNPVFNPVNRGWAGASVSNNIQSISATEGEEQFKLEGNN